MDKKVNIGDRVVLNPNCGFNIGSANPEHGTEYACEGTVKSITSNTRLQIRVLWDNGRTNGYNSTNLTVIDRGKDNPNISFRLKKERGK